MRIGKNPMLEKKINLRFAYHRVIVPVFIPELIGYYAQSFEVLKLCIDSLLKTIHDKTQITVISNACCDEVTQFLRKQIEMGKIDQLIEYQENKGKVDPVVAVMRGCMEELVTVSDADVLFTKGWQQAVEELFYKVPYAGMVSPLPYPKIRNYYSSYSWFYGVLTKSLVRIKDFDISWIQMFNQSIGCFDNLSYDEISPIGIKYKGITAVIGAGHFCATYHRDVIHEIPFKSSGSVFKGAESQFFDAPVEKAGLMRLSTSIGYVYHMGNTFDDNIVKIHAKNQLEFKRQRNFSVFPRRVFKSRLVKYVFSKKSLTNLISKYVKSH